MNYLCLWLSLFGIFAFKNLNRSSLRFFVLACESTQKQTTHKLKLIYRTTLNKYFSECPVGIPDDVNSSW